jgi:hypothetical protein
MGRNGGKKEGSLTRENNDTFWEAVIDGIIDGGNIGELKEVQEGMYARTRTHAHARAHPPARTRPRAHARKETPARAHTHRSTFLFV